MEMNAARACWSTAMVLGFCSVLAAGALTNLGQSIVTALYEPVVSVF